MKIFFVLSRIVLGALMLFSGLNKFFAFVEMEEFGGSAGEFMGILAATGYLDVVGGLEVVGGAFLVTGFFVPLGLVLLGPVVVNILLFHGLIEGNWAFPMAIGSGVLFAISMVGSLRAFRAVFRPTIEQPV